MNVAHIKTDKNDFFINAFSEPPPIIISSRRRTCFVMFKFFMFLNFYFLMSTDNRQRSTVFVQIVNLLFSDVSTTYYLFSLVSSTRLYHNFQLSIFNFQLSIRKTQQLHIIYFQGVIGTSLPMTNSKILFNPLSFFNC